MRRASSIAVAGIAALGIGGCGLFGGGDQTAVESSPEVVSPVPTETATATTEGEPSPTEQVPAFPDPTVTGQSAPRGILPPDLIGSTDPNQRVAAVQSNRPDPFALLPTTPTVQLPPEENNSQNVPALPNLPQPNSVSPTGLAPERLTPGGLAPIPQLVPSTGPIAPPPPQPTLARAVAVTGVVQVGNTTYAIVNAPNEPSSRYVRVGQRLSNGQVLVKRIEMGGGAEPIVILEENGIEVATAVGEGGVPDATETPTAALTPPQVVAAQPL